MIYDCFGFIYKNRFSVFYTRQTVELPLLRDLETRTFLVPGAHLQRVSCLRLILKTYELFELPAVQAKWTQLNELSLAEPLDHTNCDTQMMLKR